MIGRSFSNCLFIDAGCRAEIGSPELPSRRLLPRLFLGHQTQRHRRFRRYGPSWLRCPGRGSGPAVARRFARPNSFPFQTEWRCEQWLGNRVQFATFAKIDHQKSIVAVIFAEVTQEKTGRTEDRPVHAICFLFAKTRVLAAQPQKIDMKIVKLLVFLALAKIKLAANKRCRIGRYG